MSNIDALKELEAKVAAGEAKHKDMDVFVSLGSTNYPFPATNAWDAYLGSLAAAQQLHEAVLPSNYGYLVGPQYAAIKHPLMVNILVADATSNTSPARAWLLAIIRALIAEASPTTPIGD